MTTKWLPAIAASLLTGACQLPGLRERPAATEIVAPVAPAECYVRPTEAEQAQLPVLPPLPPQPSANAPAALQLAYEQALRRQAQLAGNYYRGRADTLQNVIDTNTPAQRICAEFHRSQQPGGE